MARPATPSTPAASTRPAIAPRWPSGLRGTHQAMTQPSSSHRVKAGSMMKNSDHIVGGTSSGHSSEVP
ncbi:hypothetical protein QE386_000045 [Pseudoxanthomonas winnipegensis]|nr:hypothetical protein [Pseudoxanthomonas winnipegensis]